VLPAATVGGYLAFSVGGLINDLSITSYLEAPPEGWLKITADVMAHMYLGAGLTYSVYIQESQALKLTSCLRLP
jgi:hypothetical protein